MDSYCFECFPIFHRNMANSLRSVLGFIDASDSESKLIFRIMQDLQGCHAFAPSKLSSMFQTNSHSSNLFGYNFEFQLLDTSNAHVEQFAFEVARFLNTIWKHFANFYNCHLFFELPSAFVSILIGNWSESRQNVLRMLRLIISNNFRES